MKICLSKFFDQLKIFVMLGIIILITHYANLHGKLCTSDAAWGLAILIAISLLSIKIKEAIPLKIPAFAWASLLSLFLTLPQCPVAPIILNMTKQISAGQIGTVILGVAGISVGMKIDDIKRLSWKIILVAIVVFCGTFFGSALMAQLILKAQGLI